MSYRPMIKKHYSKFDSNIALLSNQLKPIKDKQKENCRNNFIYNHKQLKGGRACQIVYLNGLALYY